MTSRPERRLELDLADPGFVADPYPALARLREAAPVLWHEPTGQWLAFTYAAANAVLRDRRFGRLWQDKEPAERFEPFNLLHRNQMMENEPPDAHPAALAGRVGVRARPRRAAAAAGAVELADALLDDGRRSVGAFDLIAGLRRAAAGGGHRRAARRARGRPAAAAAVVGAAS